jgi:hypothetical protein
MMTMWHRGKRLICGSSLLEEGLEGYELRETSDQLCYARLFVLWFYGRCLRGVFLDVQSSMHEPRMSGLAWYAKLTAPDALMSDTQSL